MLAGTHHISGRENIESPRLLRRLQTLRRWSHEQEIKSFFTRGPRTRCSLGRLNRFTWCQTCIFRGVHLGRVSSPIGSGCCRGKGTLILAQHASQLDQFLALKTEEMRESISCIAVYRRQQRLLLPSIASVLPLQPICRHSKHMQRRNDLGNTNPKLVVLLQDLSPAFWLHQSDGGPSSILSESYLQPLVRRCWVSTVVDFPLLHRGHRPKNLPVPFLLLQSRRLRFVLL